MLATKELLTAAALCALFCVCGLECPAEAQPARVTAATVCAVHRAVSHRNPLPPATCRAIAAAINETDEPVRMHAIGVNESGTRPDALRVTLRADGLVAYDVGGWQVRCLVDPERGPQCINGPAKGLTVNRLINPETNIRTAWSVYEMHDKDPGKYNGATTEKRRRAYRQRIEAIEAALLGLPWTTREKRTRGLCERIQKALKGEPKS